MNGVVRSDLFAGDFGRVYFGHNGHKDRYDLQTAIVLPSGISEVLLLYYFQANEAINLLFGLVHHARRCSCAGIAGY